MVVLCGETDPRFVVRLRQQYDQHVEPLVPTQASMAIVVKRSASGVAT